MNVYRPVSPTRQALTPPYHRFRWALGGSNVSRGNCTRPTPRCHPHRRPASEIRATNWPTASVSGVTREMRLSAMIADWSTKKYPYIMHTTGTNPRIETDDRREWTTCWTHSTSVASQLAQKNRFSSTESVSNMRRGPFGSRGGAGRVEKRARLEQ